MRNRPLYQKLYIGGGTLALAGVALVASIVFAGPGVVLLALALMVLLAGLVVELLAPSVQQFRESLGPSTASTRSGRQR